MVEEAPDREAPPAASLAPGPAGGHRPRRPWRDRWLQLVTVVAPVLISGLLWVVAMTTRKRFVNAEDLFARWARGEQVLLAFWHNRVVMMPVAARGERVCIMNSLSRDGEIATRALARWGIRSVRGSASRGGAVGFRQLVRAFREGYHLAVVPDGPRGPRCVAKVGVVHLARTVGAPIIPVSYAASRARVLGSWDRLVIPLPFARIVFQMGAPLVVPREATPEVLEACRAELERRLNEVTAAAERAVRGTPGGDGV